MAESQSADARQAVIRQALSISVALVPFAIAFGVVSADAGLSTWEALGFSTFVFTGGSQFAAVSVLADGGTAAAAIAAGLLLSLRSLAFGVVMAPSLRGSVLFRALASQLMIDESLAVATGQTTPAMRRFGYFAGGLSVFVLWNIFTVLGASVFSSAGDLVTKLGVDATIPASFLALVWARLHDPTQRMIAAAGVMIALVLVPITPAGIPIVAAAAGTLLARPWREPAP